MTSLRNFQNEIDEIRHRELIRQRAPAASVERAPKKGKSETDSGQSLASNVSESSGNLQGLDEQILTLLLSDNSVDHDSAKDMISSLLMQHQGEYIFRAGHRPPHSQLFANELSDDCDGWTGIQRTDEDIERLRPALIKIVKEIGGKASVLHECRGIHSRFTLLVRLPPLSVSDTPEVRCAVVGNVDSGKSTTLGVLTRGALDDGRGKARVWLFRHKHEIETGRTSSVGMEILGFDASGLPILPRLSSTTETDLVRREKLAWEEISQKAAKIVSFIDLAGHERYLKTTLYGLTSGAPSCVLLMVGANAGIIGMSKEHLAISLALSVPVVVCITKIDMTPPNVMQKKIEEVVKILKSPGCRKSPVFVRSREIAVELATCFAAEKLCPIFLLSNVTGEGLDALRTFLNLLPSSEADAEKFSINQPLEYSVTEVWSVPYVGTVVNGILNSGTVKTGDAVLIGPDSNGKFQGTIIRSMQRKRASVTFAEAGQCVSLALKRIRRDDVRKGMVLVHRTDIPPRAVRRFEGQVLVLYHNTTLQKNYQAMLHCGAVRQTVRIIGMDHPQGVLRTGDRAKVQFEFISHPEYVKEGMKLLFREGKTKASSHVYFEPLAEVNYTVTMLCRSGCGHSHKRRYSHCLWLSLLPYHYMNPLYEPVPTADEQATQSTREWRNSSHRTSLFLIAAFCAVAFVFYRLSTLEPQRFPSESDISYQLPKGTSNSTMQEGKKSVGYFVNWGIYGRKFPPSLIPASDLTHILYAFANIRADSGEVFLSDTWADKDIHYPGDSWNDSGNNLYGNFKAIYKLKERHRHLKVLLSIGGWTYSPQFHPVVVNPSLRSRFVESSIKLLEDYGLDGLDIDYEYPQTDAQARGYVDLLKELRENLDNHAVRKGADYKFLLTIAAPCGPDNYKKLYIKEMDKFLNFWNLMAYDFSGSWDTISNHQANLFGGPISASEAVNWYISKAVARSKIVLGIPLYGRSFTNTKGPGSTFSGIGPGSWEAGVYDYRALPLPGSYNFRDEKFIASWTYDYEKREMVSFDDEQVGKWKGQYIQREGLGGSMFWELSGDKGSKREGMEGGYGKDGQPGLSLVKIVKGAMGGLEKGENWLRYEGSQFENMRKGMP
ncbi:hypothetical protein AX17_005609 [Amanita inopinata Kibby_2008]|nr:hypothetical protein AX17_005609 [Amanita inopinata Kibby_2008]